MFLGYENWAGPFKDSLSAAKDIVLHPEKYFNDLPISESQKKIRDIFVKVCTNLNYGYVFGQSQLERRPDIRKIFQNHGYKDISKEKILRASGLPPRSAKKEDLAKILNLKCCPTNGPCIMVEHMEKTYIKRDFYKAINFSRYIFKKNIFEGLKGEVTCVFKICDISTAITEIKKPGSLKNHRYFLVPRHLKMAEKFNCSPVKFIAFTP